MGIERGIEKKAYEDAFVMIKDFNLDPKEVANKLNISLEVLLEKIKNKGIKWYKNLNLLY